jgi:hypothetical protein
MKKLQILLLLTLYAIAEVSLCFAIRVYIGWNIQDAIRKAIVMAVVSLSLVVFGALII